MKRNLNKLFLIALLTLLWSNLGFAQSTTAGIASGERIITFRFQLGQDMFYALYGGNDTELNKLYSLVDEYRADITAGRIPIHVDGYCASGETAEAGFNIAVIRSNRVKSELITHKGLAEGDFITKNHATAYRDGEGNIYKDMVVVTLHIPAKADQPVQIVEQPKREEPKQEVAVIEQPRQPVVEEAEAETPPVILPEPAIPSKPYCIAIRTNLLYDAFLTPTLGVEWRVNHDIGIKLDGSRSWWGNEKGKVQKIWLVSPEVRWYLLDSKRFYVGLGGNYGEYNIYKGILGDLFSDDTGYQGKLYGGGLTVGYQLYLSRSFSLDFNLGLGYTRFEYDSFTVTNETRVKEKDKTKNFWGPTQAGVSLIWTIGGNK